MQKKFHIKRGDTVQVISGEDKGKQGRVLKILVAKDRALVEGVNMAKKHVKPNAQSPNGGVVSQEGSIHISNLMVVDTTNGKPTKTYKKLDAEGKMKRYSKSTNKEI